MNHPHFQILRLGVLIEIFVFLSACQGLQLPPRELSGGPRVTIAPKVDVEWVSDDRAAIHLGITNNQAYNVCLPTFAKSEAGSNIELTTASGGVLRPKLVEDIIPKSSVGVVNIAPNSQIEFVVLLSFGFTEEHGKDFKVRYEALAIRCNNSDDLVKFPLAGELVLIDSGVHRFTKAGIRP